VQYFATGTSGTDFGISSATDTHTFNLPTASSINRGALSSADWATFSGKVGGSGAAGQVAYWDGTSSQAGSNNLFWNNSTNLLGIGTATPAAILHVLYTSGQVIRNERISGDANGPTYRLVKGRGVPNAATANLLNDNLGDLNWQGYIALNTVAFGARIRAFAIENWSATNRGSRIDFELNQIGTSTAVTMATLNSTGFTLGNGIINLGTKLGVVASTNGSAVRIQVPATDSSIYDFYLGNSVNTSYIRYNPFVLEFNTNDLASTIRTTGSSNDLLLQSSRNLQLAINGGTIAAQLYSTGNLVLQNGGTFTDGGQRLQVQGTTLLNGNVTFSSATGMFWDAANSRLGIGVATPLIGLDVSTGGRMAGVIITGNPAIPAGTGAALTEGYFAAGSYAFFQGYNYTSLTYIPVYVDGSFTALNPNSNGNVAVGTATNGGFKFDVNGTTRLNGNVTFSSATGMFWDATNSRLGIGTNAPGDRISISTNVNAASGITITNTSNGSIGRAQINIVNNSGEGGYLSVWGTGTGLANKTLFNASKDFIIGADANVASGGTSKIQFFVNGYNFATNPQLSLHSTGNLSLGSTSDTGERLQVTGTMKVTDTSSNSLNIVSSNVLARITIDTTNATPNGGINLSVNGTAKWGLAHYRPSGTNTSFTFYNSQTSSDAFFINGDNNRLGISTNTPTARLDIPESQTTNASLRIRSGTAPTSPNDGDIWFDGTDIKMRIGGVTKTFTLI
jgi:hypothetical protein